MGINALECPVAHSSPHLLSNKPHCRHLCMGTFTLSSLSHCSSRNPSCGHHTTLVHGHFRKFWHKRLMIKRHKRLMIKTVSLMIQAKDTKCFRYFQYLSYLGGVVMDSLSLLFIRWPTFTWLAFARNFVVSLVNKTIDSHLFTTCSHFYTSLTQAHISRNIDSFCDL